MLQTKLKYFKILQINFQEENDGKEKNCEKDDGFLNTKCVAYGTADAITDKSYVVYTSFTL